MDRFPQIDMDLSYIQAIQEEEAQNMYEQEACKQHLHEQVETIVNILDELVPEIHHIRKDYKELQKNFAPMEVGLRSMSKQSALTEFPNGDDKAYYA